MSQEVAERRVDPVDLVVQQVRSEAFLQQLEAALPENVSADRFARVTVTAIRENPKLVAVGTQNPNSLFNAIVRCAQDGLLPNGHEAALIDFKNRRENTVDAVYMPMIGGFRKIAGEHGWSLRTQAVHENDEFAYELGDTPKIVHRPALRERGEVVAAYAIGVHRDGRHEAEVMNRAEIEKVRDKASRTSERGPWVDWFERMAEKTVGRRLFKKLPLDGSDRERIVRVVQASELAPAEAAAQMYGPEARTALETGDGQAPAEGASTPPQKSEASLSQEEQEASDPGPPAPDFVGEEPPPPEKAEVVEVVDQVPEDEIVAAAGAVEFASGRHKGRTIQEIHEQEGDGQYLLWAMKQWSSEPIKSACTTYVLAKGLDK